MDVSIEYSLLWSVYVYIVIINLKWKLRRTMNFTTKSGTPRLINVADSKITTKLADKNVPTAAAKRIHVPTKLKDSQTTENEKWYHCVLCEEKFTEHQLMIDHFRWSIFLAKYKVTSISSIIEGNEWKEWVHRKNGKMGTSFKFEELFV